MLINLGMGALFLDLAHKLYVWRVYLTFQPDSPMSWGSWVLIIVYGALMASALVRLPQAWPWLGRRVPVAADALRRDRRRTPDGCSALGWANIVLGVGLGIYTGILLNTMVARPLWNTGTPRAAVPGLGAVRRRRGDAHRQRLPAAPSGARRHDRRRVSALVQQLGAAPPERRTVDTLIRADIAFLAIELVLLGLVVINLQTSSASHAVAAALIVSGPYAWAFWGVIVALGILVPLALQGLELGHRIPHTVVPALLVLVGGFALRWVMVNAGQASHIVHAAGL